jgi:DNA modification methylase
VVFIKVIFGSSENMKEVQDNSVHMVVTSPPYYNAPFDFPGLFSSYDEYLDLLRKVGKELLRVPVPGRYACFVTQDVRINKKVVSNSSRPNTRNGV